MNAILKTFGAVLLIASLPLAAANASIIYQADLDGTAAGTGSSATGNALVTLEDDMNTLDVMVTFANLIGGPAAAAHIHCCVPEGSNAPVRVPFGGFPSATSGSFSASYNLSTVLLGISVADFLTGLDNRMAYVNIHNAEFPAGEIRGQLVRVPEPASLALFGFGLAGLGMLKRRRAAR